MNIFAKLFLSEDFLLWFSLALLLIALAFIGHRRGVKVRERAERARQEADAEDLGGNSYFMPLPPVQQAVEIDDQVEIDSLLAGESVEFVEGVRERLEALTDIPIIDEPPVAAKPAAAQTMRIEPTMGAIGSPAAAAARGAANLEAASTEAVGGRMASLPGNARPIAPARAAQPATAQAVPTNDENVRASVRELVLTWFEARGYRSSPGGVQAPPLEVILRHRKEADRVYGFVGMRQMLTADQSLNLLAIAKRAGITRLLIASETPCDPSLAAMLRHDGIRVFDEAAIQAELGKTDIRVAAKIIAVARGRGRAGTPGEDAAAVAKTADKPPVLTARF